MHINNYNKIIIYKQNKNIKKKNSISWIECFSPEKKNMMRTNEKFFIISESFYRKLSVLIALDVILVG